MKLKKIASLMLAGIMAVSMLAACGDKAASSTPAESETPVDSSFATAVNNELSTSQKNTLKLGADANVSKALKTVSVAVSGTQTDAVVYPEHGLADDFRNLLGVTSGVSIVYTTFDDDVTSKETGACLIILTGDYTEKGLAKAVANELGEQVIADNVLPAHDSTNKYQYSYSGAIDYVKVNNVVGEQSVYVVGLMVTQTATPVSNLA